MPDLLVAPEGRLLLLQFLPTEGKATQMRICQRYMSRQKALRVFINKGEKKTTKIAPCFLWDQQVPAHLPSLAFPEKKTRLSFFMHSREK